MLLLIDKMLLFFTRKYVAIASGSRRIAASILPLIALGKTNASRRTASEDIVMHRSTFRFDTAVPPFTRCFDYIRNRKSVLFVFVRIPISC